MKPRHGFVGGGGEACVVLGGSRVEQLDEEVYLPPRNVQYEAQTRLPCGYSG